jgi:hypothetical protein
VVHLQYGMDQVRQEDKGRQQGRQILFPMAVVVFEAIALGFEPVVVFVLSRPRESHPDLNRLKLPIISQRSELLGIKTRREACST